MARPLFLLVTCEHGGNRLPSRYASFFRGHAALLRSHRGYDTGCLRMARALSDALGAPLVASTITRLLIDLNRSPDRADLYSEFTREVDEAMRREIFHRYYLPFRTKVETQVAQAIAGGRQVLHISSHSFTPQLHGEVRNADVGLLYDPARTAEAELCRHWRDALLGRLPELAVRMNYPYLGTDDGFTTALRRMFPQHYAGIELELNQKHVREHGGHWQRLRTAVSAALVSALQAGMRAE